MLLTTIHIDINFSLFGLIILGMLAWGGYRGYKRGGIIMGLSLFALGGGFIIAAAAGRIVYFYFLEGAKTLVPEVFGSIVLGTVFIGAIWFSVFVQKAVHIRVLDAASDKTNDIVGAILGFIKFFIIVAVYSVVILNLNCKGNFLPERDAKSKFMNFSKFAITKSVKMLRMDYHLLDSDPCSSKYNQYLKQLNDTIPQNVPPTNNTPDSNNTNQNLPINNQTNNNINTSQPNNNQNNNGHPIVDDVNNP